MANEQLKALSILVIEKTQKDTNRKFMTAKVRAKDAYDAGAGVCEDSLESNVYLDVKLTKASGVTLPAKEGIYEVDSAVAFEDTREDCKRPTLWIKPKEAGLNVSFHFKRELPTNNDDAPRRKRVSKVIANDCKDHAPICEVNSDDLPF